MKRPADHTYDLPLSNVELLNRPTDMKLVFTPADILPVVVHSNDEEKAPIGRIRSSDISVSLDLTECAEEGNYEIPAQVTLPDGYELSSDVTVAVTSLSNTEAAAQETYISAAGTAAQTENEQDNG